MTFIQDHTSVTGERKRQACVESPPKHKVSKLPILEILVFLDWPLRIRLVKVLRELAIEHEPAVLPEEWVLQRLAEEGHVYPTPEFSIPISQFLQLRHQIVKKTSICSSCRVTTISSCAAVSSSVSRRGVNFDSKSGSVDFSESTGFMRCDDDSYERLSPFVSIVLKRISRPLRLNCNLSYSPEEQAIIVNAAGIPFRKFYTDSLTLPDCPVVDRFTISDFLNGRNVCVIVTGDQDSCKENLTRIIRWLLPFLGKVIVERNADRFYRCDAFLVLNNFTNEGLRTVRSCERLFFDSDLEKLIRDVNSSTGHICFRVSLNHFFTSPHSGSHANTLTILVPRNVRSAVRTNKVLNMDVLALRKSLRALQSQQTYVPIRESKLTEFIRPDFCDSIKIIACVSDASETSRRESMHGLRFAEQFSSRCTAIH